LDLTALPLETTNMTERINATVLAAHLDLKRTRIRQLVAEGVLRRRSDGSFDLDQSRISYIRWLRSADRRASKSASASRVQDARARQIELATARVEGELCTTQEAIEFVDEVVGGLRAELSGFAARVTRDVALRQILDNEITGILARAASRWGAEAAELRRPKA
jgi:hypothetical protein